MENTYIIIQNMECDSIADPYLELHMYLWMNGLVVISPDSWNSYCSKFDLCKNCKTNKLRMLKLIAHD